MIRSATCFLLLCLSCLLSRPATAQPINPLPARVVQLLPGDVVRERLVGIDSATYQASRTALALVPAGDAVQANLRHQVDLASQQREVALAELRRCQAGQAARDADIARLAEASHSLLAVRPRPPWLLDSHTYKGAGLGAAALLLLKVFVFHN